MDILSDEPILKGATKIGFDTCFIFNVAEKNIDIQWLRDYFFPNKSVFYYMRTVEREFKSLLHRKTSLTPRQINEQWNIILETFSLQPIRWSKSIDESLVKIDEVNKNLAAKRDVSGFSKMLRIGRGDIEIISAFMNEKLDRIYTSDDGFYQTCKALNLNVIKVPYLKYLEMKKKES